MYQIDVKYINPFLESIIDVFKEKFSISVNHEKPYIKKDEVAEGIITAIIVINGDITGSLSITLSEEFFKKIFGFKDVEEIDNKITEKFGEIINEITKRSIDKLKNEDVNIETTIPSIISGKSHTIQHIYSKPIIALPFNSDSGRFIIEFTFKKN